MILSDILWEEHGLWPVSYTHLDVYKRQDLDSVRALMEQADGQTAAVIVEAVGANMGVVPPKKGFLEGLRTVSYTHLSISAAIIWQIPGWNRRITGRIQVETV